MPNQQAPVQKKTTPVQGIVSLIVLIIIGYFVYQWFFSSSSPQKNSVNTSNINKATETKPSDVTDSSAKPTASQNNTTKPTPSETTSQKNAVRSAKDYLDYAAFSHDGLVAQLEYEQYSHADAVYGADKSGADWNEQAAESAKQYMEYSSFSRGSLIDQLLYEKFTQAQAEYGAKAVGL